MICGSAGDEEVFKGFLGLFVLKHINDVFETININKKMLFLSSKNYLVYT